MNIPAWKICLWKTADTFWEQNSCEVYVWLKNWTELNVKYSSGDDLCKLGTCNLELWPLWTKEVATERFWHQEINILSL